MSWMTVSYQASIKCQERDRREKGRGEWKGRKGGGDLSPPMWGKATPYTVYI